MASKPGRNDPCSCGSGKKYKNCCGRSGSALRSRKLNQILAGLFFTAILVVVASAYVQMGAEEPVEEEKSPPLTLSPSALQAGKLNLTPSAQPQPPGPVPEGKIWNAEHGHWHDVTAPTGEAPEGKVWSTEHAHWHDEGETGDHLTSTPSAEPTYPAPREGMTWNAEHGHWHGPPSNEELAKARKKYEEEFGSPPGEPQELFNPSQDKALPLKQPLPTPERDST